MYMNHLNGEYSMITW